MNVYQIATVWDFYPRDMNAGTIWEECTQRRQTFATLEAATATIQQDAAKWREHSGNNEADKDVPLLEWDIRKEHHSATIPNCEPGAEWFGVIHIVEVRE